VSFGMTKVQARDEKKAKPRRLMLAQDEDAPPPSCFNSASATSPQSARTRSSAGKYRGVLILIHRDDIRTLRQPSHMLR